MFFILIFGSPATCRNAIDKFLNAILSLDCSRRTKNYVVAVRIPKEWGRYCFHNVVAVRIPKEWGRYCFHRNLSVHTRGGGGTPSPSLSGGGRGVTPARSGRRSRFGGGGYPHWDWIWSSPLPPGAAERVLATRRAVCLLRLRRRTFLFHCQRLLGETKWFIRTGRDRYRFHKILLSVGLGQHEHFYAVLHKRFTLRSRSVCEDTIM